MSGAAALAYEVAWLRSLELIFGAGDDVIEVAQPAEQPGAGQDKVINIVVNEKDVEWLDLPTMPGVSGKLQEGLL